MLEAAASPAPPRRVSRWRRRLRGWAPGLVIAAAWLAVGLATLPDYGVTWDERESYSAGSENLEIIRGALAGERDFDWPWHELTGYQFLFDSLRGATAAAVHRLAGEPVPFYGFRLFNLLLSTAALLLVYLLGWREGGSRRLGILAATCLALQPKFLAHSQNNPKDTIGLFVVTLVMVAAARAARRGTWRSHLSAGVVLGLALANHVATVPAAAVAALWTGLAGHGGRGARLARTAGMLAVAPACALLLWPWLWPAPLARLDRIVQRVAEFPVNMEVLYLGQLWLRSDPPWHYTVVSLAVATPVLLLLAAAAGAWRAAPGAAEAAAPRRLARLALLWLGGLLAAELFAAARYDGVRHVLAVLPAIAILAAAGVEWGWRAAVRLAMRGGRWGLARRLAPAAAVAAGLAIVAQMVPLHPYHDAYLNPVANALAGPHTDRQFELEYWGQTYKEGAEWLLEHAAPDAVVLVPVAPVAARPYLDGRLRLVPRDRVRGTDGPVYLMLMTRRSWYTPRVQRLVATRQPVFAVRRQRATLLEIYRLDEPAGAGGGVQ